HRRRRPRRPRGRRPGGGHPARRAGAHLRTVLHHAPRRDRPRPGHLRQARARPRGRDSRALRARRGRDVHGAPSGGVTRCDPRGNVPLRPPPFERRETRGFSPARGVLRLPCVWTLARKILLHDRVKFAVASAGVSISVLPVLVEIGLYFGFMQNASNLIDHSRADLWVTGEGSENFDFSAPLDERIYYRVLETPGVAAAERMILAFGQFRQAEGGTQGVQVVGLEKRPVLGGPWNVVAGDTGRTAEVDGIVVDQTEFGKLKIERLDERREISGARAKVVGLTKGIRSFTTSPFVFTNLDTARTYTRMEKDQINYVLVKAQPGVPLATIKARLD